MVQSTLNARFFESTRGRIVDLLRRSSRTVDELASELEITDNAVRLHLGMLERDGVVRSRGVRREGMVGKPATMYEIAPDADPLFSNAYLPFLSTLLASLADRMSVRELRALMRDVGHRLAGQAKPASGSLQARAELASRVLNELGGLTTVETVDSGTRMAIRGCGCPLSVAVCDRAEVCVAVQTMLGEVTGTQVREQCDRSGDRPQCCFELTTKPASG
jgi:predicted ArsR family transcriptional regulator